MTCSYTSEAISRSSDRGKAGMLPAALPSGNTQLAFSGPNPRYRRPECQPASCSLWFPPVIYLGDLTVAWSRRFQSAHSISVLAAFQHASTLYARVRGMGKRTYARAFVKCLHLRDILSIVDKPVDMCQRARFTAPRLVLSSKLSSLKTRRVILCGTN